MVRGLFRRSKPRQGASLPDGVRIYAVGDVHGRLDLLDELLDRIDRHRRVYPIARPVQVFVGDYIDRGPASAQVLDRLIAWSADNETVCLKGNHDTFIFEFLRRPAVLRDWSAIGGLETLRSYALKPMLNPDSASQKELSVALRMGLPKAHRTFLGSLQISFSCGRYFFVHAGVRPGIPLQKQSEEDLLWIRDEFLLHEQPFEKIIVHGHTPVRDIDVRPNRINIDTGAFATGKLSCLIFEQDSIEPLQQL